MNSWKKLMVIFTSFKPIKVSLNKVNKSDFEKNIFLSPTNEEIIKQQNECNKKHEDEFKKVLVANTSNALNNLDIEVKLKDQLSQYYRRLKSYKSSEVFKEYESLKVQEIHKLLVKYCPNNSVWEDIVVILSDLIADEEFRFDLDSSLRNTNALITKKFKNFSDNSILDHTLNLLRIFDSDLHESKKFTYIKNDYTYLYVVKKHTLIISALFHDLAKSSKLSDDYSDDYNTSRDRESYVFHAQVGSAFFQKIIINDYLRKEYGEKVLKDKEIREVYEDLNEIKNAIASHHDTFTNNVLAESLKELDRKARDYELNIQIQDKEN